MLQESKNYSFAQRFQFSPPLHKFLLLGRAFLLFLLSTLRSLGRSFPLLTPAILLSWSFLILISLVFLSRSLFLLVALLLDSFRFSIFLIGSCFILIFRISSTNIPVTVEINAMAANEVDRTFTLQQGSWPGKGPASPRTAGSLTLHAWRRWARPPSACCSPRSRSGRWSPHPSWQLASRWHF